QQLMSRDLGTRPPVLEVSGASRAGEFTGISFVIRQGEVVGLIGLLGSGRTELALSLFGMTPLARGEVKIDGVPVCLSSNRRAIRAGLAYVSEDRLKLGLNLRQSIADNVSIVALDRLRGRGGFTPPGRREALARRWIARLGIKAPLIRAAVQTLSGGNQQRVVLAKWLATKPRILLLDSPTVGVDISNKQGIYAVIREFAAAGVAILLISDEVPEVYFNCHRILHMRAGRIASEFVPGVISEPALAEAINA
ncbi:MAG: ATP-binding cassette domain-containing protein, partial [Acetobacteraceae bacterium]